jgi:glyceraldehyde 3-phosphate dehydrogenase
VITVGLFGFGRIGRSLFRLLYRRTDIRIGAISDLAEPPQLAYLLRFDTILGRFPEPVSLRDGRLVVADGAVVPLLGGKDQRQAPWGELGIDTVIEATSRPRTREALEAHFSAGAKRVIVCGPTPEPPDLLAVAGLTDGRIEPGTRIVSLASPTVQCVAPILRILQDAFGIRRAIFNAVHSYTSAHRLADVPAEDMRRGRAAAENIVPQQSRSPGMLIELMPELAGRLSAAAVNVPVQNGSAVDLVCWHEKPVSEAAVNEAVRAAARTDRWKRSVAWEEDPIVSSDVSRSDFSCTFDSLATMTLRDRVSKTLSWFDSGFSFARRAVEMVERFAAMGQRA